MTTPIAAEPAARSFGHNANPVKDFCFEIDALQEIWTDMNVGVSTVPYENFRRRIDRAMKFRPGDDSHSVHAKMMLRQLDHNAPVATATEPATQSYSMRVDIGGTSILCDGRLLLPCEVVDRLNAAAMAPPAPADFVALVDAYGNTAYWSLQMEDDSGIRAARVSLLAAIGRMERGTASASPHPPAGEPVEPSPDALRVCELIDQSWTKEFPDGPDTKLREGFFFGDDTLKIWRLARMAIASTQPRPEVA